MSDRVDSVAEALWAHVEQDQSGLYVDRSHEGGELLDGVVDMRKLARAAIATVERVHVADLIADVRDYLKRVTADDSWFCVVDDINSILDGYERGQQ